DLRRGDVGRLLDEHIGLVGRLQKLSRILVPVTPFLYAGRPAVDPLVRSSNSRPTIPAEFDSELRRAAGDGPVHAFWISQCRRHFRPKLEKCSSSASAI